MCNINSLISIAHLDVLFVSPNSSRAAYQDLADIYSAIEPPTWALLLAQACRSNGFRVGILDADAERLTPEQGAKRIVEVDPRLVCFVVYGQNPNSGTTNMVGAIALAEELRKTDPKYPICFVGSHTSALPKEVLAYSCVDFVLLNEGVYAIQNLLRTNLKDDLSKVKGIGFKRDGHNVLNTPEGVVPNERMDIDLPGYAWDLLPMKQRPLDMYRAHFWHAEYDHNKRTPFAAIYSSLGCRFGCDFCMINIVNRVDNGDQISAANSKNMRFWSPQFMLNEFQKLADMGVQTVRISDEMFFLDRRQFEPLVDGLVERDLGLRMWAYARVDTVRDRFLDQFRKAGIGWLAIGIESGSQVIRKEVSKGTFKDVNIRSVCRSISDSGINVISNYIFGFPDEGFDEMNETLSLAVELNTEMANMYACQALPGSPLYMLARKQGWALPDSFSGYGFLSYECQPLPTKYLTSAEVLKFRDEAWSTYFSNPKFLNLVETKFGSEARKNLESMATVKLKRRLLGDL